MKRFFSEEEQADLSDIDNESTANHMLHISLTVMTEQIEQTIHRLSNGKALGPDGISNKILKEMVHVIKDNLT